MCAIRLPHHGHAATARAGAEQYAEAVLLALRCRHRSMCSESLSGSEKMLLENVMLSCGPQTLATSSIDQLNEQWSMTTFLTGLASLPSILSESRLSGSGPFGIVAGAHANVLDEDVGRLDA